MRTIPTDEIEHVEVVRGIPSVEYGDLTSGLIKIERRKGGNKLNARFKADSYGKLIYVGKGFEWEKRKLTLNVGVDFLDSKIDPRDSIGKLQTFQHVGPAFQKMGMRIRSVDLCGQSGLRRIIR